MINNYSKKLIKSSSKEEKRVQKLKNKAKTRGKNTRQDSAKRSRASLGNSRVSKVTNMNKGSVEV